MSDEKELIDRIQGTQWYERLMEKLGAMQDQIDEARAEIGLNTLPGSRHKPKSPKLREALLEERE